METNPKVPVNLLRMSRVLLFEPFPGIKANLHESLSTISPSRFANGPIERVRLHFLLARLHAVVQEGLRYVPLGWSKTYEFNNPDLSSGLNTIDIWLDSVAQGRSNLTPDKIKESEALVIPDGSKIDQFVSWFNTLPDIKFFVVTL